MQKRKIWVFYLRLCTIWTVNSLETVISSSAQWAGNQLNALTPSSPHLNQCYFLLWSTVKEISVVSKQQFCCVFCVCCLKKINYYKITCFRFIFVDTRNSKLLEDKLYFNQLCHIILCTTFYNQYLKNFIKESFSHNTDIGQYSKEHIQL
jgi:hypothetical protein